MSPLAEDDRQQTRARQCQLHITPPSLHHKPCPPPPLPGAPLPPSAASPLNSGIQCNSISNTLRPPLSYTLSDHSNLSEQLAMLHSQAGIHPILQQRHQFGSLPPPFPEIRRGTQQISELCAAAGELLATWVMG